MPFDSNPISSCQPILNNTSNETCTIALPDGSAATFRRGSVVTGLISRCGPNFQCLCNPDIPITQLQCNFCAYPTINGSLVCAHDGQTVSFTNASGGMNQYCLCSAGTTTCYPGTLQPSTPVPSSPISPTIPTPTVEPSFASPTFSPSLTFTPTGNNPTMIPATFLNTGSCQIRDQFNGSFLQFANGSSFGGALTTRCGPESEYPCYCLNAAIVCPYCGFPLTTGQLICAKNNQTIQFQDAGTILDCFCAIASDGTARKSRQARDLNKTLFPTTLHPNNPSSSPTIAPVSILFPRSFSPIPTHVPTLTPTFVKNECLAGNGTSQGNSTKAQQQSSSDTSNLSSVGPCGPLKEWPFVCDSTTTNNSLKGIIYPYCIFETYLGEKICAKNGQTIQFTDVLGDEQRCTCIYFDSALGGLGHCQQQFLPSFPSQHPSAPPPRTPGPIRLPQKLPSTNLPPTLISVPVNLIPTTLSSSLANDQTSHTVTASSSSKITRTIWLLLWSHQCLI